MEDSTDSPPSGEDPDHDDDDDDHSLAEIREDGDVEELIIKHSDVQESTRASESGIFSGVSAECDNLASTRLLLEIDDSEGDKDQHTDSAPFNVTKDHTPVQQSPLIVECSSRQTNTLTCKPPLIVEVESHPESYNVTSSSTSESTPPLVSTTTNPPSSPLIVTLDNGADSEDQPLVGDTNSNRFPSIPLSFASDQKLEQDEQEDPSTTSSRITHLVQEASTTTTSPFLSLEEPTPSSSSSVSPRKPLIQDITGNISDTWAVSTGELDGQDFHSDPHPQVEMKIIDVEDSLSPETNTETGGVNVPEIDDMAQTLSELAENVGSTIDRPPLDTEEYRRLKNKWSQYKANS